MLRLYAGRTLVTMTGLGIENHTPPTEEGNQLPLYSDRWCYESHINKIKNAYRRGKHRNNSLSLTSINPCNPKSSFPISVNENIQSGHPPYGYCNRHLTPYHHLPVYLNSRNKHCEETDVIAADLQRDGCLLHKEREQGM